MAAANIFRFPGLKSAASLVLVAGMALASLSCGPDPYYKDIKTNPDGGLADQGNGAPQPPIRTMPVTPTSPVQLPAFYDAATGQVKDLPMYPGSLRTNLQYGPISGYDNLTVRAKTHADYDTVTKYYDEIVKKEEWTVVGNNRSPDNFSWQLSKGTDDLAQIAVAKGIGKDTDVYITISRSRRQPEKPSEGGK